MNLFVQEAAEQDLLRQVEWYAEQGLPDIARRFHAAVFDAIDALLAMPEAGPPKHIGNLRLAGASVMACQRLRRVPRLLPGASRADNCRPHPAQQKGHRQHSGQAGAGGTVVDDVGLPDAGREQLHALLAAKIIGVFDERKLTVRAHRKSPASPWRISRASARPISAA